MRKGLNLTDFNSYNRQYPVLNCYLESDTKFNVMPYSRTWQDPIITFQGTGKVTPSRNIEKQNLRLIVKGDVTDIKVIPENFKNESGIWNPDFLMKLKSMNLECLRFMDWMKTNNSSIVKWDDRPKLTDISWVYKGIPLEAIIDLANSVQMTAWLNVPFFADNDYILNMAKMCKKLSIKPIIEFSNEVWNPSFDQCETAQKQGLELGLSKNPVKAGWLYYAKKCKEVHSIFKKVLGKNGFKRAVCVQTASPDCLITVLGEVKGNVDLIGIAPYMGVKIGNKNEYNKEVVKTWTVDQLLDVLEFTAFPRTIKWMTKRKQEAGSIPLVMYESGQEIVQDAPHSEEISNLMDLANRSERMGRIYKTYYDSYKKIAGEDTLALHYSSFGSFGKVGCWTLLEDLYQETSPKYEAFLTS